MALLFKQPRGQVHRDVAHLYRHFDLHDPPVTYLYSVQGLASRVISTHKGSGNVTYNNARSHLPQL